MGIAPDDVCTSLNVIEGIAVRPQNTVVVAGIDVILTCSTTVPAILGEDAWFYTTPNQMLVSAPRASVYERQFSWIRQSTGVHPELPLGVGAGVRRDTDGGDDVPGRILQLYGQTFKLERRRSHRTW